MSTKKSPSAEGVDRLARAEKVASECIECSLCVQHCEFLSLFCESPRQLAESFKKGDPERDPYIPYLCTLCGLCEEVCPMGLNIGEMCLEARRNLVSRGLGPLPAHKATEKEQERVLSDRFTLSFPDPVTGGCSRIFFPGCHLSGYSPDLVTAAYDLLRERMPDTGFMLRCCGAPTRDLGKQAAFEGIMADLERDVSEMGATELIAACPKCIATIRANSPGFAVKSVYEVLADSGPVAAACGPGRSFALHDPCSGRWDGRTQESVRLIVRSLGCELKEFENKGAKTTCCGMGGMVAYVSTDMSSAVRDRRLEETPDDIVTYCASCRESFAARRPALHILDLLFNPHWEADLRKPPLERAMQQDNQWILKKILKRKFKLQD